MADETSGRQPCRTAWAGRLVEDPCDECGHMLLVHVVESKVCSVCAATAPVQVDGLHGVDSGIAARVRRCVWVEQERTSAEYDPEVFVELDGVQYAHADELLDAIVGDAGVGGL